MGELDGRLGGGGRGDGLAEAGSVRERGGGEGRGLIPTKIV